MFERQPSIQRRILTSITVVLLVLTTALSVTFGAMIYRRIDADLQDRLDKALTLGWKEYLARPESTVAALQYMSGVDSFHNALDTNDAASLHKVLSLLPNVDFAAYIDANGTVVSHTNTAQNGAQSPLASVVAQAIRVGNPQISTEKLDETTLLSQAPGQVRRVAIPLGGSDPNNQAFTKALVQVMVVPVKREHGDPGALVAGILLNNTFHIQQGYSSQMSNSFLSISCEGIRIVSNISTESGMVKTGGRQGPDLINTVNRGERFFGYVPVDQEKHLVGSDPIRNSAGEVVGALSLGLPPTSFANLQRDALLVIVGCGLLSFILAVGVAQLVARRFAKPVIQLEQIAIRLASCQEAQAFEEVLNDCDQRSPTTYSREMTRLYQTFASMAHELGRRYRQAVEYLEQLKQDREELQNLTTQLQESKADLEQKVAERTQELTEVIVELKQANTHKSKFLATMSHELRTPLNSIIGFSEMLSDELFGPLNDKQHEYVNNVLSSAQHLLELITDVLNLSRIEQGRLVLEREEVLVSDLVESVHTMVKHQAEAEGLKLQVELAQSLPGLWADPTRMKEILYNLLSNAIKFTPTGGQIWVRAWNAANEVVIEVEDTGIGMKPEDQVVVFDEFVQAESAYRRRFEGVGLGLPLAKKLVELHGGRIELESQVGKGTSVRVYLPVDKPTQGGDDHAG